MNEIPQELPAMRIPQISFSGVSSWKDGSAIFWPSGSLCFAVPCSWFNQNQGRLASYSLFVFILMYFVSFLE